MKRILITGENSFLGNALFEYLKEWPEKYEIEKISLRNKDYRKIDFSKYDVIYHVAGIAHVDVSEKDENVKRKYYDINTKLTVKVAENAKKEGVGQFIFMSSAIIFGDSADIGKSKVIKKDTIPKPSNYYGDSKLKAEQGLEKLRGEQFKVCLVRPPMIYGKNCKGNYQQLARMARKLPIFPDIKNKRSMLYVGNLVELIRMLIDNEEQGYFYPQNEEYVCTSNMVQEIAKCNGKKIRLIKFFNPFIKLIAQMYGKYGKLVNKAFGNFIYDKELSEYSMGNYRVYNFEKSIKDSEEL